MTFDSYTDKIFHRSYTTYTYHYIDDWNLKSIVLKTSLMEKSHTAENLRDDFQNVLKEYHLENKRLICITDSAANMCAACRLIGNHRVACIAHKTNSLVQTDLMTNPSVKEIPALLAKMRAGQKKLMYKFDEMRQLKDKDNQNHMALFLNELCELEEIVNAEENYASGDDNLIREFDCDRNSFSGLKTLQNIRWSCMFKVSMAYKNNASTLF